MRKYFLVVVSLFVLGLLAKAETKPAPSRILGRIDEARLTVLRGNTHRLALAKFDVGAAPPDLPMQRMLLVLKHSPEQEKYLAQLLHDLQDPASPHYHKWLTPEDYGKRFGPSDDDVSKVTDWLHTHGFDVANVARSKQTIEFSGAAAQVQEAFHTAIHKYQINSKEHWANASDPQIPAALEPVVAGVATLHNFYKKPMMHVTARNIVAKYVPGQPLVTFATTPPIYALGPPDFATIYNITPLYKGQNPINGQGTVLTIVGRTNFNPDDVSRFQATFGVSPENFFEILLNGPDPGNLGGGEEVEALLDTSWAASIAPEALVNFIASASTNSTDGVDLSTTFIVDNNYGDIMTESFGTCEADATSTEITFHTQAAEEAAAQGITYLVASGDTGSAGCDLSDETSASGPLSVNLIASSPFDVAVGGTQFNDLSNPSTYWSATNNQFNLSSAKSYIPENVWNESCTAGKCNGLTPNILATGGGVSTLYPKPDWQVGVPGIPNDGVRDLPDVSFAAAGHTPYLLCFEGSCTPDSQGFIQFLAVEGTSAPTPSFAGILALVHQAVSGIFPGEAGRLGQVNNVLYRLAAITNYAKCNGSSTGTPPAATCVFNDVTVGNNDVPGEVGYGGSAPKYPSGVGYDLASGLGSINVTNLVNSWTSVGFSGTNTTLSLNPSYPTQVTHGSPVTVQVNVSPAGGTGTPTGDVSLYNHSGTPMDNFYQLDSTGSVSTTSNDLPGGNYALSAHYAGDKTFAPSDSPGVIIMDILPEPSNTAVSLMTLDANDNFVPLTTAPYGSFVYVRADVTGQSGFGTATGRVTLTDNGSSFRGNPYLLNSGGNTETPQGIFTFRPGTHSILASYAGDQSFNPSTSPATTLNITPAATTAALQGNTNLIGSGKSVLLTATIGTNGNGVPPSGVVNFFNGSTDVGSAPTLGSLNLNTGKVQATASFSASQLPNGDDSITAQYVGDGNYLASTSSGFVVTVVPDFEMKLSGTSLTLPSTGGSASTMVSIQGSAGYNATVSFTPQSCINLPPGAACSFSPSSVIGSGTSTLTISASGGVAANTNPIQERWRHLWMATAIPFFAGIFLLGLPGRRRSWRGTAGASMFILLLTCISCGGGGGSSSSNNSTRTQVAPGTYTVIVQISAEGLTRSAKFTLAVQ